MKVLYANFTFEHSDCIVGIGIFDGVHIGHKRLISVVKKRAISSMASPAILTFHPHPVEVLTGKRIPLLLPLRYRIERITRLGLGVMVIEFDKDLAGLTAVQFLNKVNSFLKVKEFVAGEDFVFGRDQVEAKKLSGFYTVMLSAIDGKKVSSSRIRELLFRRDIVLARRMLGYWPRLWGRVVRGEGRAREMGFPTANLELESDLLLSEGVYIVKVYIGEKKKSYWGLMSIGKKPSFGLGDKIWIEVYLNEFTGNLYNKILEVAVYNFIREQVCFESREDLKQAIKKDVEILRKFVCGQSI